ncbi:M16 family metallopeptidase [Mangrovibacterium lignilyticum]|uniref:M16 family metallopeptidase n=1 Tax=Mangrovibacterium lignilyticum TaxID=2668052 RepID=UPI0013D38F86|nr:pitrilysin family protein [Mangrovibacterium lignilyticum]
MKNNLFRNQGLAILCLIVLFVLSQGIKAQSNVESEIDIPFQKYVLENGLTLIVHEDHKAPIVAVNIWYHVGAKNEKEGKTGFAHLFEHLMFNGSENYNDDYFKPFEEVGATDMNGTTNSDRTNYFENVPVSALDMALWMESDRMGHLVAAIDTAKLNEQRGVVQNEKRQGENQPYAVVRQLMPKNCFPAGHPYSWTVIGSMEDLDGASLDDVHEWFKTYYGAANAVIVIAGDIEAETAYEKVKKYFGDIPSGPPIATPKKDIAKRSGTIRETVEDRVPQARIYKTWNVPAWGTKDANELDLISDVLASGKTSRLYKRLVIDDQIATDVAAYIDAREIAGLFQVFATAKPGEDLVKVEQAIDEELTRLLNEGPTEVELKRVKAKYMSNYIRGIERVGGFGGKSDILASSQIYGGSPDYFKTNLSEINSATTTGLQETAKKWLSDGVYILEVHPFPTYQVEETTVDRSKLPVAGEAPDAVFPEINRKTLSNGLKIVLAERHSIPVVNFNLMIDAGYAADQFGLPGTASLAMNMLDEGTKERDALEISDQLAMLGAQIASYSDLDNSFVSLSALKKNLDASLDIYADIILNPAFPEKEFSRLQKQQLARIQQEKSSPFSMALRLFPGYLYGKNHAYGNSFTGSGTEASVTAMTTNDLVKFQNDWFKPNNATIVVVGDITMDEVVPKLEKLLANWKQGTVPVKNISKVELSKQSTIYLMDKPGSPQSVILSGNVAPPKSDPDDIAMSMMNSILGGTFTSRLNMNLREDKHWSYGAGSVLIDAKGQRLFVAYAPVQADKTKESIEEIVNELTGIQTDQPATSAELKKVQQNEILGLPGSWETARAVSNSIVTMEEYQLPADYYKTYAGKIKNLNLNDIQVAQEKVLHPDQMVWVVVGDRTKVESGLKELGFSEIRLIDTDGNPIE